MSRAASQSQRAQQARSGIGGYGADGGVSAQSNGRGGLITVSNGSVINYGGVDKFGLYPTVGVSIGFLNQLDACCRSPFPRFGVNTNFFAGNNIHGFLM